MNRLKKFSCDRCEEGYRDKYENVKAREHHCPSCWQEELQERREQEDAFIKCLRDGLNEKNRAAFDAMDRELQLGLCAEAFDDGIIGWTIGGKTLDQRKEELPVD